jgi:hypothetical protein
MKVPCYKCLNRSVECHNNCEYYILYKKQLEDINKTKLRDNIANTYSAEKSNNRARESYIKNSFKRCDSTNCA